MNLSFLAIILYIYGNKEIKSVSMKISRKKQNNPNLMNLL